MNIFATYPDPDQSARILDDRRLVKMALETAQLLSTALVTHGHPGTHLYKPTHHNHPCSIWTRESQSNYMWCVDHLAYLGEEYTRRFRKTHKSVELLPRFEAGYRLVPGGSLTPFANATHHKDLPVHTAYRTVMREKWEADGIKARWTGASPPRWR